MTRTLAFCWVVMLALAGCKHIPSTKEKEGAETHFQLGVLAQQNGNVQDAYREYQAALELNPDHVEALWASAILLHVSFHRPEEAIARYKRALELRPNYSEAKVNLGDVYLDQGHYDDAIKLYEDALNDMLYATPYIAQNNLGWAQYKRGDKTRDDLKHAIENIKSSVTLNPKFCLGYRNLGTIQEAQGQAAAACQSFTRYREHCPEVADAYYREGVCRAKIGDNEGAKTSFAGCQSKSTNDTQRDDCKRLLESLQ